MNLLELMKICQTRVEQTANTYIQNQADSTPQLIDAMSYSVLNGGKRIRPLLVYATGYALGAPWDNLDLAACALEFIHTYSLIHDDLPAMDNSDLRRGKPTCHKAFNEALAILAGDALQPLAFEVIASHPAPLGIGQRLDMIKTLANASGYKGMVAGQTLDLAGMTTLDDLKRMYELKTGALLIASAKLGALAANIQDESTLNACKIFAGHIGLAFQIQDDLLDIENSAITGKTSGLDIANNKITFPRLLGIEKTRTIIEELFADALAAIDLLGSKAEILRELAHYILERKM